IARAPMQAVAKSGFAGGRAEAGVLRRRTPMQLEQDRDEEGASFDDLAEAPQLDAGASMPGPADAPGRASKKMAPAARPPAFTPAPAAAPKPAPPAENVAGKAKQ